MNIQHFIKTLPIIVVGIAMVTSLIGFKYDYPRTMKILSLLWVLNFLDDLAGHITRALDIRNSWLYNIYFWIQYLVLAYLYFQELRGETIRTIIRVFYFIFPVVIILETFFRGLHSLQTGMIVAGGGFMIFLSAAYFRQLYLSEENEPLTRDPWFWFSFGFLVHFGGTVPFLGMLNYIMTIDPVFARFYYLYFSNSFTILLNILVIAGFLCRRNFQNSHSFSSGVRRSF